MNKYLSLILIIAISGCASLGKSKNIISFSALVSPELEDFTVQIPEAESLTNIGNDFYNKNLRVKALKDNQKFNNISFLTKLAAEPLMVGNDIYVLCSDGVLYSYAKDTLKQNWNMRLYDKKTLDRSFGGGIAFDSGKLYVTSGSQELFIINANNGRKVTVKRFSDALTNAPVIKGGIVYILTLNNELFALAQSNLVLLWDHAGLPESLTYSDKSTSISFTKRGEVLVTYSSGQVFLLNPNSGEALWQKDFSDSHNMPGLFPVNFVGEPILDGDSVYLADSTGVLYKLDVRNGRKIWSKNISDIQTFNKVGNIVLAATNGRQMVAVDINSGKVVWSKDIIDFSILMKQKEENRKIEEYNRNLTKKAEEKKEIVAPRNPLARAFYNLKSKFPTSEAKPKKPKTAKLLYNRDNAKPINVIESFVANDLYILFTSKGDIYYVSPKDGQIIDQKNVGTKLSYVLVSDEFVLSSDKKILLMK